MLRRSVNGVLGQLANEGLLTDEQLTRARELAVRQPAATPWYVRVLVGAGAWVASWMVIGFLAVAGLLEGGGAVVFGVGLFVGATVARGRAAGDFGRQLWLSFGLAGGVLLVFGVGLSTRSEFAAVVAALFVGVVTVAAFPDVIARFLGGVTASAALVQFFSEVARGPEFAVAMLGVGAAALWQFEPRLLTHPFGRRIQRPLAWALLTSFLFAMVLSLEGLGRARLGALAAASSVAVLVVLVGAVAREHGARWSSEPVVVAMLVAATLGVVSFHAPGLSASLVAILLAFHRRSPVMLGVGLFSLVGFLTYFYSTFDLTLLLRGVVLLASGALLLVARVYVRGRFGPIVDEEVP